MTASDRKKVQVLVVLLAIAGLTWFLVYRTRAVTTSANATKPKAPAPAEQKIKETKINVGLIESADAAADVGRKNIFQYRQPLPPAPAQTIRPSPVAALPNTPPPPVYVPLAPQPPPFKAWKFDGYSVSGPPQTGKIVASLSEGSNTYQVTLGECLLGQYCVRRITENSIEIEDLQTKRRNTFPRTPAP